MSLNKDCYNIFNLYNEQTDRRAMAQQQQIIDKSTQYIKGLAKQLSTSLRYTGDKIDATFANIIDNFEIRATGSIPTMAVTPDGQMLVGPQFISHVITNASSSEEGEQQLKGVIYHEAFHIYNGTFQREAMAGLKYPTLWNMATDWIMNKSIIARGMSLPPGGLIPEQRGDQWFVEFSKDNLQGFENSDIQDFSIDVTEMSALDLYNELEKYFDEQFEDEEQASQAADDLNDSINEHGDVHPEPSDSDESEDESEGSGSDGDESGDEPEDETDGPGSGGDESDDESEEPGSDGDESDNPYQDMLDAAQQQTDQDMGQSQPDDSDTDEPPEPGNPGGDVGNSYNFDFDQNPECIKAPWIQATIDHLGIEPPPDPPPDPPPIGRSTLNIYRPGMQLPAIGRTKSGSAYFKPGYPSWTPAPPKEEPEKDPPPGKTMKAAILIDKSGSMSTHTSSLLAEQLLCLYIAAYNARTDLTLGFVDHSDSPEYPIYSEVKLDIDSFDKTKTELETAYKKTLSSEGNTDSPHFAIDAMSSITSRGYNRFIYITDMGWTTNVPSEPNVRLSGGYSIDIEKEVNNLLPDTKTVILVPGNRYGLTNDHGSTPVGDLLILNM